MWMNPIFYRAGLGIPEGGYDDTGISVIYLFIGLFILMYIIPPSHYPRPVNMPINISCTHLRIIKYIIRIHAVSLISVLEPGNTELAINF